MFCAANQHWQPLILLGEVQVYSLNARNPLKGQGQQPLHSDVPRVHATDWRAVNSMIMLDDMMPDNGPTRVVPGSHNWTPINVPDVNMAEVTHIAVRPRIAMSFQRIRAASPRGQGHGQGRFSRGDQRPHLARRHPQ